MNGGDPERELWQKYAGRIRGYGLRHLRDAASADDLVQHVMVILLRAIREGRAGERERLDGWVFVTCRNSVMDMRRDELRQRRLAERSAVGEVEAHEPAPTGIDQRRLEMCMAGLEARDRAVVLATFVEDRDAEQISQVLQISAGNVRVIRHRALARLQACVEGRPA